MSWGALRAEASGLSLPRRRESSSSSRGLSRSRAFDIRFATAESLSLARPRESNQREGRPASAPASQVREPEPGFSTAHPVLTKTRVHPCTRPLRGLIVSVSPLPRGPEKQRQEQPFLTFPYKQGKGQSLSTTLLTSSLACRGRLGWGRSCSWVPWERRVAEVERGYRRVRGGERRACLRPWMAEFAPPPDSEQRSRTWLPLREDRRIYRRCADFGLTRR